MGTFGIGPCLGYQRSDIEAVKNGRSVLVPGICCKVVDTDTSLEVPKGKIGRFILKLPLIPSRAITLLHNDERFVEIYFKKYPVSTTLLVE